MVPVVSANAGRIYQAGQLAGRDPNAFSVLGDCQSQPSVFMGVYDTEDRYFLGEGFEYLQETIDRFKGSFAWDSTAVENGLSVTSALSPLWADAARCASNESPLDCEIRLHNPSFLIISLGTNWDVNSEAAFEEYLRQIVVHVIEQNVVPIIATKADNIEGNNALNEAMARVAYNYDIPLWNFWRTVQHLPNNGVDPEKKGGFLYLTVEAWNIKSFTGLQALDAVWRAAAAP